MKPLGSVLMVIGFILQVLAGILALGCLLASCRGLQEGGFPGFLMMIGLAVVIGWIGQYGGGLLLAAGMSIQERDKIT